MKQSKTILGLLALLIVSSAKADINAHFSCEFNQSVFVDASGLYEAPKWSSKGFSIQGDYVVLDKRNLKLKLTTNIDKFGTIILRGAEQRKGYQFSLENGQFIYVQLMIPLARSWTVTGTCSKD
jgi:hypothetical protein